MKCDIHLDGERYPSQEAIDLVNGNLPIPTADQVARLASEDDDVRIAASDELEAAFIETIERDGYDAETVAFSKRISICFRA